VIAVVEFELDLEADDLGDELVRFAHEVGSAIRRKFDGESIEEEGVREMAFKSIAGHVSCGEGLSISVESQIGAMKELEEELRNVSRRRILERCFGREADEREPGDRQYFG